jgi:guanosine-3',5'-bis(diphosphate) 3'-pyrophosphohydrolase
MHMDQENLLLLLKAIRFASLKHNNHRRKDADESPYINHPIAVAEMLCRIGKVTDMATIIAGILHDTIEDTDTTPEDLQKEFNSQICSVVEEVTDDKGLSKEDRKRLQIENAHHKSLRARQIKLADKICNIQDLAVSPPSDWSEDRKIEYIRWSMDVINEIRGTNADLENYFDNLCSETEQLVKAPKKGS